MRINFITITSYKNLKNFTVEFRADDFATVLLGRNASGKSNFIEALVRIFRNLHLQESPPFAYIIDYTCWGHQIKISAAPFNAKSKEYQFIVDGAEVKRSVFFDNIRFYLPKHIFTYYSGPSNRLEKLFDQHQFLFYQSLLKDTEELKTLERPLFYVTQQHARFVIPSFYISEDPIIKNFLEETFGILGFESMLFVLKQPEWYKGGKANIERYKSLGGDERFWYSRGVVRQTLSKIYDYSLAPVHASDNVRKDFIRQNVNQEHLYLFIPDEEHLRSLAGEYTTSIEFFKALQSIYLSDLLEDLRVRVKKRHVDGSIQFTDLSEGEQQLLTVLGLIRFTTDSESLILLDEPDTHLNPAWQREYTDLLKKIVGSNLDDSQLIMTTHSPLIAQNTKQPDIILFKDDGGIVKSDSDTDFFRGWRIDQVLTSELFGLKSARPKVFDDDLDERAALISNGITTVEQEGRLEELENRIGILPTGETTEEIKNRIELREEANEIPADVRAAAAALLRSLSANNPKNANLNNDQNK